MTKPQKQSFLYGSTVLMTSMIVVKLIGALFKIPLTNLIGLTGMGYFNSAYNVYTTVYALTVTGLSAAVARLVAENASLGKYRSVESRNSLRTLRYFPREAFSATRRATAAESPVTVRAYTVV